MIFKFTLKGTARFFVFLISIERSNGQKLEYCSQTKFLLFIFLCVNLWFIPFQLHVYIRCARDWKNSNSPGSASYLEAICWEWRYWIIPVHWVEWNETDWTSPSLCANSPGNETSCLYMPFFSKNILINKFSLW